MKKSLNTGLSLLVCGLMSSTISHAEEGKGVLDTLLQGQLSMRLGVTSITPMVSSGDLSAPSEFGSKIDVLRDVRISGGFNYAVTPYLAIDVPFAEPFEHEIVGDGQVRGVGKIGSAKALPAVVFLQYRMPNTFGLLPHFTPYVGAGPTYAKFYDVRTTSTLVAMTGGSHAVPTTMTIDSKFAPSFEVGFTWADNNNKFFMDASVVKTYLTTYGHLSTGQNIKARLDPLSVSIGIGMNF